MNGPRFDRAPEPPQTRERPIDDQLESPDAIAHWACDAAAELGGGQLPESVAASVATVAGALAADALANDRPPWTIRVTVTDTTVDVAVTGRRSIAHRTLSNDAPALVEARKLTTRWMTRLGPGGRGSVVTASVPLRSRRRFAWPRRRRSR